MDELPESTRLLYTQLLSQCLHCAAPSGRGLSFVAKQIKGNKHWYLQLTVGSRKTQHYLGPDTAATRSLIAKESLLWETTAPDLAAREQLVAMLVRGGAFSASSVDARVFELLERTGVFLAGGVLVGSHAFVVYGNMLGVRWESEATRTQDVDIAADSHMVIGVPNRQIDLRRAIVESELGFFEIPALDPRTPSTKFRIRGKQLSVDFLTPLLGRTSGKPIHLKSLGVHAEPVRFLDYLLSDAQPAVIVAKAGLLVNVPAPARYALHKLVLAERRIAAFHTKTKKNIWQARQLLDVLLRDRPGDLRTAIAAARKQPSKFLQQLESGLHRLPEPMKSAIVKLIGKRRAG